MEKYNLKDDNYTNLINGLCLAKIPIEFYGEYLHHLTVKDILIMGEEEYKKLMMPFMLSKEVILKDVNLNISMLDILTDISFQHYCEYLKMALKLLFKIDDSDIKIVSIDGKHNEIIINNRLYINGDKFEQLRLIILKMNNLTELKKKDIEKSTVKSSNEEYNKRLAVFYSGKKEYEENKKKDKSGDIYNLYNLVVHLQNKIDYDNVLNFSIYQLYNSVKNLNIKEDYDFTRRLYSSGQITLKNLEIPIYYKQILE